MTVNSWTPDNDSATNNVDFNVQTYLTLAQQSDLEKTVTTLEQKHIDELASVIKNSREFWQQQCDNLNAKEITALIFFFALAEEKHSALSCGNDSPVIALNKLLKANKTPLSKDDLLWIKSHSSNRFLPNGSIF